MDKLADFLTIMAWFWMVLSFVVVLTISTNITDEDLHVEKKMLPWILVLMVSMFWLVFTWLAL